jgi:hypothetical protein
VRRSVPFRLLALSLRVKVLMAVAAACVVALTVGIVGVLQLGALQQRSPEINTDALVPSNQIAEVRGALLQTRIDALADELLPDAAAAAKAHELYLVDIQHHGRCRADPAGGRGAGPQVRRPAGAGAALPLLTPMRVQRAPWT